MKLMRIGVFTATLALAAVATSAQDLQFGAHGGLNLPLGDLDKAVDGRLGFTFGGHVGLYYGNGHELRPRVDYTHFPGGWTPTGSGLFGKNTISAWGLGADYLYYTELRPQGFYLTMGLGFQGWTVDPSASASTHKTALSLAAGAGFRFNRSLSFEGRFMTGQFQSTNGQANALQLLASLRF
jgi:hypothetical protein